MYLSYNQYLKLYICSSLMLFILFINLLFTCVNYLYFSILFIFLLSSGSIFLKLICKYEQLQINKIYYYPEN